MREPTPPPASLRLLIVEDNPGDARLIREILSESLDPRYETIIVDRLAAAKTWLAGEAPDAVLLDFGLPDSSGLDSIAELKAVQPSVPIVVLTGLDEEQMGVRALNAGAQDFLLKSDVDGTVILRVLRYAIERSRVEKELRDSERRYRDLVESSRGLICEHDLDGRLLSVNRAVAGALGYEPEEIVGRHLVEFVAPVARPLIPAYLEQLRATGTANGLLRIVAKSGEERIWSYSNSVFRDARRPPYVICHAQDVTERQQIEIELKRAHDEALRAARHEAQFLANMSHEIRTPMNGVLGMTGLLLETALTPEQLEYVETIRASADSLLTIVNDVLDFSKVQAGALTIEGNDFDLRHLVEGVEEILAEQAQGKGLELVMSLDPGVPARWRGDAGRLRQVLTNLVGNAVKFTERGEIVVRVSVLSADARGSLLRFAVSDTGIGISPEHQALLFRPFVQVDGSSTRQHGGTGLGLAICKQLAELMGGEIGVESRSGGGSTFWVTVRLQPLAEDPAAAAPPEATLAGLRALIVDDSAAVRSVLVSLGQGWGIACEDAPDGPSALDRMREAAARGAPFDIAIIDLVMPGMDGMELASRIKAEPAIADVLILLLNSLSRRKDTAAAYRAGVHACLTKPVRQSQLFDTLARIVAEGGGAAPVREPIGEATATGVPARPLRILVAEDNEVNRRVALRQLEKLGYQADFAKNGAEAVQAVAGVPYDVVLMDCQMPKMDGYEATAEIRRLEGPAARVRIIAMTAHALAGDRERCLAAGMDDYVSKPVQIDVLRAALARVPGPAAVQEPPRVHLHTLWESAGDDPEMLRELVALYMTDTAETLARLRDAVAQGDAAGVESLAHSCAGSSANCGMISITPLLRELERRGHERLIPGSEELIGKIEHELACVTRFLSARSLIESVGGER